MTIPLVGNSSLINSVLTLIKTNRIPHAVLIDGDEGTGRHTLAEYIAKSAVCKEDNKPCNKCKNCHLAEIHSHPDIIVTAPEEKKKNITVEQIRQLRTKVFVMPHMSDKRVFIIDKADTMNEQSQNALLKVLEEPPQNVIFILISALKSALLDTIISRCITLSLYPPDYNEAKNEMLKRFNDKYSESEICDAIKTAHNNIGTAIQNINGNDRSIMVRPAKEFLNYMFENKRYDMLKVLSTNITDRVKADNFFKELKYQADGMIRSDYKNIPRTKALYEFGRNIKEFEKCLKININLGLLFCYVVDKATIAINQNF